MNTQHQSHRSYTSVQQLTNNATSWLGHKKGDYKEVSMGQTFVAPAEGDLETIEVFSSIVSIPGQVVLSLHSFDPVRQEWGPSLGSDRVNFNQSCNDRWVSFHIPGPHLVKGLTYGFRLESHDSYVGMGEAAGSSKNPPFESGKEWKFISNSNKVDAFSYFSLAFKVEIRA